MKTPKTIGLLLCTLTIFSSCVTTMTANLQPSKDSKDIAVFMTTLPDKQYDEILYIEASGSVFHPQKSLLKKTETKSNKRRSRRYNKCKVWLHSLGSDEHPNGWRCCNQIQKLTRQFRKWNSPFSYWQFFRWHYFLVPKKKNGTMTVVKDCTGEYFRFYNKDYRVCNLDKVSSFPDGAKVKATFKKNRQLFRPGTNCFCLYDGSRPTQ